MYENIDVFEVLCFQPIWGLGYWYSAKPNYTLSDTILFKYLTI